MVLSLVTPLPNNPNQDIYFSSPLISEVPEPATALRLGSGLLGFAALRQRAKA